MDGVRKAVRRQDMFVLEMDDGETWTIPGTNSSIRFIANEETAPFAIVHSRGMPDDPVPPHFHKFAIDTWLVLQGKLKVWAGDQGRVLCAGDFAFVPPGITHAYQVIEPHTEFMGLIHPSEWVNFFKAIGEVYKGAGPFPSTDSRPFPREKFGKAIKDGHDVVPQFGHRFPEAEHEWSDSEVPSKPQAYFLKAHRGPRYALGGQTIAPLCLSESNEGKFSISYLEAAKSVPSSESQTKTEDRCLVVYAQTGAWNLKINGSTTVLHTGDSAYVPPQSTYSLSPKSNFARAILFCEGSGPEVAFQKDGKLIKGVVGCDETLQNGGSSEGGVLEGAAKAIAQALPSTGSA